MAHPKKKWGQHFLRNRGAVERIVAAIEPREDETILEVGPGEGVLTGKVVELGRPVIVIEIDPDLAARLRSRFGDRIELRNEDAVDAALPEVAYCAVGNLPYNVGTPILRRVVADRNCRRSVFMLQKEVASRLVAAPGSEDYGFLTLAVQLHAKAKILLTLEPKSFHPPPKVRSAVVVLERITAPTATHHDALLEMISASFRMRRKKLVNNLIGFRDLTREQVLEAMGRAEIDEGVRAETMSLAEFDRLAMAFHSALPDPGS